MTMLARSAQVDPLTLDQLAKSAPAVFAEAPHSGRSKHYAFLKTIDIIGMLAGAGWRPVWAAQGKARDLTREGVQRHVVRLRHPDAQLKIDGLCPELVLVNSHDGTTAYKLHAGLFRMVCGNGLIVASSTFAEVSLTHNKGLKAPDVIEASYEVIREVPKLAESVEAMRSIPLSYEEQTIYAESAARLRWDEGKAPISSVSLLQARRTADTGADIWGTYNRVQENLVKGGLNGRSSSGSRRRTRSIGSVAEDTRINKALWHLADEMRRLKHGESSPSPVSAA